MRYDCDRMGETILPSHARTMEPNQGSQRPAMNCVLPQATQPLRSIVCFHRQHKVQRRRDHTGIENHRTGTTLSGGLVYDRSVLLLTATDKASN